MSTGGGDNSDPPQPAEAPVAGVTGPAEETTSAVRACEKATPASPGLPALLQKYDVTRGVDTGQPILFGQKSVNPKYNSDGKFKGMSIEEVAAKLLSGDMHPDDLRIEYIWVNGQKVVVNNRSLTALSLAGMTPTNFEDMSDNKLPPHPDDDSLENVLMRLEEMDGKPSEVSNIRESKDRASPIVKQVRLPKA